VVRPRILESTIFLSPLNAVASLQVERLEAAKRLCLTNVLCIEISGLPEAKINLFYLCTPQRVALFNRRTQIGKAEVVEISHTSVTIIEYGVKRVPHP